MSAGSLQFATRAIVPGANCGVAGPGANVSGWPPSRASRNAGCIVLLSIVNPFETQPTAAGWRRTLRRRVHAALLALLTTNAAASDWLQRFTDPADGMFDMSEWLLDHKGFCRCRS